MPWPTPPKRSRRSETTIWPLAASASRSRWHSEAAMPVPSTASRLSGIACWGARVLEPQGQEPAAHLRPTAETVRTR